MILKLTNSKGRVVYEAEYKINEINEKPYIDVHHECGGGCANKPDECFLGASCSLNDNPSCKIEGTHKSEFLVYLKQHSRWLVPQLRTKFAE